MRDEFGARLRELRGRAELTQRAVARELDVSEAHVSKWENGLVLPSFDRCVQLASLLGVSLDYLMTGREAVVPTQKV